MSKAKTMMKIVVLMGSPNRNGSTGILVQNFQKGAEEAGHSVDVIDVCHANIHPCIGCVRCGYEGPCVQKDDVELIRKKLLASDMVVRVVLLSASPRKNGNSDILCHQFIKGAEDAGHDCELITLYDKKINFCRACYACFKTGKCVLNDDMADILDKVQEAEVLVIATPTYFLTMNGMLKTTIDRFLPKWQELGGHDVYLIITGHDSKAGLKLVRDELADIFQNLGNEIKGIIWGENVWQKGEVKTTKAMEEAYQAGLNI